MDQWAPSRYEGANVRLEVSRSIHRCTAGMLEPASRQSYIGGCECVWRIGIATYGWTGLSRAGVRLKPTPTVVPCFDRLPWITRPARAPRPAFTRPAFTIVFDRRRIVAYHRYSDARSAVGTFVWPCSSLHALTTPPSRRAAGYSGSMLQGWLGGAACGMLRRHGGRPRTQRRSPPRVLFDRVTFATTCPPSHIPSHRSHLESSCSAGA